MFQRQVASTNLGHGGALRHSTHQAPRTARRGHTVLLSCRVPALSRATTAPWTTAGLAEGAPGFSVLFGFAFKASFGVSETEFPLRSLFAVVSYVPDKA